MTEHKEANNVPTQVLDTPLSRLMLYHYGLWNYIDKSHINNNHIDGKIDTSKLEVNNTMYKHDPCYNIQLKEYQCVTNSQSQEESAKKCVKWYNEWLQCKWDHEKMTRGYNYIEPRPERKHRAYIAAPNYQYS